MPAPPRVKKKGAPEQEDAAELRLGEEFQGAGTLLISEVQFLLDQRDSSGSARNDSAVYQKTSAHVRSFANDFTFTRNMRAILGRDATLFKDFEIAQLGNLMPKSAEEAKSLIPSLARIDDDKLQGLLDEVAVVRGQRGAAAAGEEEN